MSFVRRIVCAVASSTWIALAAASDGATNTPALLLTGIASIGDYKRAYLTVEVRGQPAEYFTVREGQNLRGIVIKQVDAEFGEVHVVQNGKNVVLSLNSQQAEARRARRAEREFVEEHTRAHEELQRRERERLTREGASVQSGK